MQHITHSSVDCLRNTSEHLARNELTDLVVEAFEQILKQYAEQLSRQFQALVAVVILVVRLDAAFLLRQQHTAHHQRQINCLVLVVPIYNLRTGKHTADDERLL